MIGTMSRRGGGRASCEFAYPAAHDLAAARLFDRLFRLATDPAFAAGNLLSDELLSSLLMRLSTEPRSMSQVGAPEAIRRALERIDDDPAAPLTLDDLASVASLSRFQCL